MSITPGANKLGPDAGTLLVKTGRKGAAAKAGHDLSIEVTAWGATIEAGGDSVPTRLELIAEAGSLRVRAGSGGLQSLGEDDMVSIKQTIDDDVLKGTAIAFHSTDVTASDDGSRLNVAGELELFGKANRSRSNSRLIPTAGSRGAPRSRRVTGA
jgi:hypothetical protein